MTHIPDIEKECERRGKAHTICGREIPAMMQALRRQRENARALIDGLETKLSPVLRPGSGALAGVSDSFSEATPLTEQLTETISVMSLLNARLRDITARLEL